MKYLIITLSFTISFSVSSAQVKGILYYKKTIADEPATAPRVENYIVHFANNKSLETVLIPDLKESAAQTGDNIYEKTVSFTGGKKNSSYTKILVKLN